MAGMRGFEPLNGGTKTRCLTAWRHPNKLEMYFTQSQLHWQVKFLENLIFFNSLRNTCVFPCLKKALLFEPVYCLLFMAFVGKKTPRVNGYRISLFPEHVRTGKYVILWEVPHFPQ